MTPHPLSESSWDSYKTRKLLNHLDPNFFVPEEIWEFNYLSNLILDAQPQLDELTIILSIRKAMRKTIAPRQRAHFVQLVLTELKEQVSDWEQLLASMKGNVSTKFYTDNPFSGN